MMLHRLRLCTETAAECACAAAPFPHHSAERGTAVWARQLKAAAGKDQHPARPHLVPASCAQQRGGSQAAQSCPGPWAACPCGGRQMCGDAQRVSTRWSGSSLWSAYPIGHQVPADAGKRACGVEKHRQGNAVAELRQQHARHGAQQTRRAALIQLAQQLRQAGTACITCGCRRLAAGVAQLFPAHFSTSRRRRRRAAAIASSDSSSYCTFFIPLMAPVQ